MRNTVTFVTPRMAPAAGKRVVAITQIAMFDAINSIERRYQPDLSQLLAAATASKEAAAAAAARIALAGLLPQVGGQVKVTMAVISWRSGTEFYRVLPRVLRCSDKIIGNDGHGGTLVSDPPLNTPTDQELLPSWVLPPPTLVRCRLFRAPLPRPRRFAQSTTSDAASQPFLPCWPPACALRRR